MPLSVCILPRIRCGGTIRPSHKWQEMAQTGDLQERRHHRSMVHMVVRSDSIHRQHCGHRTCVCGCPHCVAYAIHTCAGGEGELEWSATCFHFDAELTRKCFSYQSPERCPGRNLSDTSSTLLQRGHVGRNIDGGTSTRAKSAEAARRNNRLSLSSRQTRNISLEHPPGPGELPDGAPR